MTENYNTIAKRKGKEAKKRIEKGNKNVDVDEFKAELRNYWVDVNRSDMSGVNGNRGVELKTIDDIFKLVDKIKR